MRGLYIHTYIHTMKGNHHMAILIDEENHQQEIWMNIFPDIRSTIILFEKINAYIHLQENLGLRKERTEQKGI